MSRGRRSSGAVGRPAGSAGAVRPGVPKLLVWDNTPPHHTDTAAAGGIEIAWLSFRSPELNPCEDLWRRLKAVVAADRCYAAVDEPADRATAWLDHLAPDDVRRRGGYREHARAGASG